MNTGLKITIAQINPIAGDIAGNTEQIIAAALQARDQQQANLVIFPAMALVGYLPQDLLFCATLHERIKLAIKKIQTAVQNICLIFGTPTVATSEQTKPLFNSAVVIHNNKILATYHKRSLLNDSLFSEDRYFNPGATNCILELAKTKIAITIGTDLADAAIMQQVTLAGPDIIINLAASPFDLNKHDLLSNTISNQAKSIQATVIYVNGVGGQDNVVFDGGSLVCNQYGEISQQAAFFAPALMPVTLFNKTVANPAVIAQQPAIALIYQALVLGVRDYTKKNHFAGIILGLSGGIDSALSLAIAVDAVGKDRVEALYLPSQYSSDLSTEIAHTAADNLGIKLSTIPIQSLFENCVNTLQQSLFAHSSNTAITKQNLQARCRAMILMAYSNTKNLLLLATGNKSEVAVGYATLYGDTAGGFCPLSDVTKTLVYQLAEYRNTITPVIPQAAITRAPSAELAPDQKDSDSLPPYPVLDAIIERYIERGQTAQTIMQAGFNPHTVTQVIDMIKRSEHKRHQAAPGVKITNKTFGVERQYPITYNFNDY